MFTPKSPTLSHYVFALSYNQNKTENQFLEFFLFLIYYTKSAVTKQANIRSWKQQTTRLNNKENVCEKTNLIKTTIQNI